MGTTLTEEKLMKSRMRAAFEDLRASTLLKMEEAPMEIGVGVEADILSDEVRNLLFLNVLYHM